MLWFGLFDGWDEVDAGGPAARLRPAPGPGGRGRWSSARRTRRRSPGRWTHILAGDIYQANLTFPAEVATAGHPLALYAAIRPRARAGWGGIVFTGEHWLLSFSPELFFTLEGGRVTARPMKGTAPAGSDPEALRGDPKQRAENLMIVDLLRNDLSRLSKPGTVKVPALFEVETYPTVLQMTSTVIGELEEGRDAVDLLGTIFPCGSVTGAPEDPGDGDHRRARAGTAGPLYR